MRSSHSKKKITAAELMRTLQNDETYVAKRREVNSTRERLRALHYEIAAPIIEDLQAEGYHVDSLDVLRQSGARYTNAIPILLKWLPKIADVNVKESIVRTLSVPWAKPKAAAPLISEFRGAPDSSVCGLKWAIGNALEIVADNSVFDDLIELVKDKRHGTARQMLAVALGHMKDPRAVDVLIELLDDEQIAGHAIIGISKLRAKKARPQLEHFLTHTKAWVRKEAAKALSKM